MNKCFIVTTRFVTSSAGSNLQSHSNVSSVFKELRKTFINHSSSLIFSDGNNNVVIKHYYACSDQKHYFTMIVLSLMQWQY